MLGGAQWRGSVQGVVVPALLAASQAANTCGVECTVGSGELSAQPTEKDAVSCAGVPGPSAQQVCRGRCPAVQDRRDRNDEEVV